MSGGDHPLGHDVWVAVDERAAVATARRRAASLATAQGFDEDRVAEVEIVASELATNLVKHGGGGDLVLRPMPAGALQLVAIDRGPGTRDLEALIRDGTSTAGTLGVGLGAVRRLASRLDLWAAPGRGAIVIAEIARAADVPRRVVGHLRRPLRGETTCGDAVAHRETSTGFLLLVADGLGHGPLAAEASQRAVEAFDEAPGESPPSDLVRRMHVAMKSTRGAAVAVSRVDLDARVLTHAAVGNISGRLLDGGDRLRSLVTQPGIVGHNMPRVRDLAYPLEDTNLVVLHSDGLTERWTADMVPPVRRHGAGVCAAALLRDAGTRRDDASVLALQVPA